MTRVNFDQAAAKKRRRLRRALRAKAIFPRPIYKLKPAVHSCSVKYNSKLRLGRGFSFEELKAVGIHPREASTIGISVDKRRRNLSNATFDVNVQRLKEYKSKLVLYPINIGKTLHRRDTKDKPAKAPKKELKGRKKIQAEKRAQRAKAKTVKKPKVVAPKPAAAEGAVPAERPKRVVKPKTQKHVSETIPVLLSKKELHAIGQRNIPLPLRKPEPKIEFMKIADIENRTAWETLRTARYVASSIGWQKKRVAKKLAEGAGK